MNTYEDVQMSESNWPGAPIGTALNSWRHNISRANDFLQNVAGLDAVRVDELALMFVDQFEMMRYISDAVMEPEVEHYNGANDVVETLPLGTEYRVRYDFLRIRGEVFRVECMAITSGFSPLHAAVWNNASNLPVVVHLSFKARNLHRYNEMIAGIRKTGAIFAQECDSTYGRFSYWKVDLHDGPNLYLKPRVNLRDGDSVRSGARSLAVKNGDTLTGVVPRTFTSTHADEVY
jgi:hypothetical protein